MNGRKLILSLSLLLTATTMLPAQTHTKARLDSLFDALADGGRTMGSICVSQGGHVIYDRAIGYSVISPANKTPASIHSRYRIASITKMFTAAIIFQLIDEHKLNLNTTLDKYFPELPGAKNITIAMMLSHRSGLHNILDDPDWSTWKTMPKTQDEIIALIGKGSPEFTPGTKAAYSNSNFILLGYIIEEVCHKPYQGVVYDRIISKAKLWDTHYGGKTNIDRGECYSYSFNNDWIKEPEADLSILGGAGALVSTPSDLNKFIEALYGHKLIPAQYLTKMQDINDGFGMGMLPYTYSTRTAYGHHGSLDGFNTLLEYFPEEGIAISYCSNGQVAPVNDIITQVVNIVFDSESMKQ